MRPILAGAVFGGVVGPALGGFLLALSDLVRYRIQAPDFAEPGNLILFPFMAVVLAGIPGAAIGAFSGSWLCRVGQRAWVRMLIGAGLGLAVDALALLIISARAENPAAGTFTIFKELGDFYLPALIAGMLTALCFPMRWITQPDADFRG